MQLSSTKSLGAGAVLPVQIAPDLQFVGTATHRDVNHGVECSEPYPSLNTELDAIELSKFVAKQDEPTELVLTNAHWQIPLVRMESENLNISGAGNNSDFQELSTVEESIALSTRTSEPDPSLSDIDIRDFGNLSPEFWKALSPLLGGIDLSGDTSLGEPANVVSNKKKRSRAPNWDLKLITSFLKSRLEVVNSKPKLMGKNHWKFLSEELKKQTGILIRWKQCEDLWGTLLKRREHICKDHQSKNTRSSEEKEWAQYWESSGDPDSANKLIRVFSLECFEMMNQILIKKPHVSRKSTTGGSKRKQMESGLGAGPSSSSLRSGFTITSVDVPGRSQAAKSSSTAPLTESVDNSKEQGHGEQQTKDERPGMANLTSEVSGLCRLLLRPNSTTEVTDQILKIYEKELEVEKSKVELAILREKNKGPRKHRKKNV